ncbi:hypothetical protein NM208_g17039 [Fusarium decemcellulare]|uniref:Uncharacterized protein n=1 Tax=Fusarium decemcellulare TaxID=57161 RepID=A0ACC1RBW9_9HYPO|nr:hypothetical protein NM208_g17039 [Fusarium decemcellulare]
MPEPLIWSRRSRIGQPEVSDCAIGEWAALSVPSHWISPTKAYVDMITQGVRGPDVPIDIRPRRSSTLLWEENANRLKQMIMMFSSTLERLTHAVGCRACSVLSRRPSSPVCNMHVWQLRLQSQPLILLASSFQHHHQEPRLVAMKLGARKSGWAVSKCEVPNSRWRRCLPTYAVGHANKRSDRLMVRASRSATRGGMPLLSKKTLSTSLILGRSGTDGLDISWYPAPSLADHDVAIFAQAGLGA